MPSTYTLNNGIELIATGEQSGTWGVTTNTNLQLLDTALDGQVTVTLPATGNTTVPNDLDIEEGVASDGRNRVVIFDDGGDLGGTAYVRLTPNDAEKIFFLRNSLSGGRSIILFQGTYSASNDFELLNGMDVVIKFDGGGSGAVVSAVFGQLFLEALQVDNINVNGNAITSTDTNGNISITPNGTGEVDISKVDIDSGAIDGTVIGNADVASDLIPSADDTYDLGATGSEWKDLFIDGTANIDSLVADTADINGGTVDGATIGGNSSAPGTFTNLTASANINFSGATISNGGAVNTIDINGGTIDGTAIGASIPSTGAFTTLSSTGNTTLGNAATDTVTINADVASDLIPSTDDSFDLGAVGSEWKDLFVDGTANIDALVADTADINGGTGDNFTLGSATPAAGTFTVLTANTTVNFAGATVTDGGSVTTIDINGGTINGITDLAVADGGTGASNASDARDNLGLTIGTNVQAYDAGLNSIAGLTTSADQIIYTTGSDTYAVSSITSFGRSLIDDADAATARTTLGLGTAATSDSTDFDPAGTAVALAIALG